MSDIPKPYKMIVDFVTGQKIPEVGAEANRQAVERFLIIEKGFAKEDIQVDVEIAFEVAGDAYRSQVDLVVSVDGGRTRYMVIKCAPGSLGSCEREILAAARILDKYQIPLSVVSDGKMAVVIDTVSGKRIGEGLDALPSKAEAFEKLKAKDLQSYPPERIEREKLIFRTYNCEYVNVARKLP